ESPSQAIGFFVGDVPVRVRLRRSRVGRAPGAPRGSGRHPAARRTPSSVPASRPREAPGSAHSPNASLILLLAVERRRRPLRGGQPPPPPPPRPPALEAPAERAAPDWRHCRPK